MAETLETNIVIKAVGGDGAAAQIDQIDKGFKNLQATHSDLQQRFTQKFEHVGLRLFAGDLIRTAGLSGEMRPILSTLMLAMNSVGAAFGSAAVPIFLVVAAFTAVVGIVSKVKEHYKDLTDQLIKLHDETQKQLDSIDTEIKALEDWRTAVGKLTPALDSLLKSEMALRAEQIKTQENTNTQLIGSLSQRIAKEKEVQASLKNTVLETQKHIEALKGLQPGMQGYTMLEREVSANADASKKLADVNLKIATDSAKLNQIIAEQVDLHRNVTGSIKDQSAAAVKTAHDEEVAAQKSAKAQEEAYKKMWALRIADARAKNKEWEAEEKKHEVTMVKIIDDANTAISSGFGNAVGQMIVEGRNFTEAMGEAFKHMAEQIISDIVRMTTEWAIFTAITGGTFGGGGMLFGAALGGAHQGGGSVVVDRPTMFLAGEGGPEIATFTPLSLSGGSMSGQSVGGAPTVNITMNVDRLDGSDPANTLRILSDEIRRETVAGRIFSTTVSGVAARYSGEAY